CDSRQPGTDFTQSAVTVMGRTSSSRRVQAVVDSTRVIIFSVDGAELGVLLESILDRSKQRGYRRL
ncbi:MAG TPA: hypothetical protein VHJ55_08300, partial [Casimicrobiaceae bacterium]|nr:hypothetical protein [Casimicrobiaceae bacterium]